MAQAALNPRYTEIGKKSQRRRQTQLTGIIFLIIVLGTIFWGGWRVMNWMKDATHHPCMRLVVIGNHDYTTNDDILQAILERGAPVTFMTQDVNVIQKKIKQLPWIKHVSVRKRWPDELKIQLLEYVPVARWNDYLRIDAKGTVFSEPEGWLNSQTLPLLYGPKGTEKIVLDNYRSMSSILACRKYTLKIVAMTQRHSWKVVLDNNTRLNLGRDNCIGRLNRFIELYPLLEKEAQKTKKRISYIDLRYKSGASVRWSSLLIDEKMIETQKTVISNSVKDRQNHND